MKIDVPVREAMVTDVITISPDSTIVDAAKKMIGKDLGGLVIMKGGVPIGMITEHDFLNVVASKPNPTDVKVKDIMSSPLITIGPNSSIMDAARLMSESKIRKIPVKDKDKLVGIITAEDIIRVAPKEIELLKELAKLKSSDARRTFLQQPTSGECEMCGNYSEYLDDVDDTYVCNECKKTLSQEK